MTQQDIRWLQSFSKYRKALANLYQSITCLMQQKDFSEEVDMLLQDGLKHRLKLIYDLSWKVMKEYAEMQGHLYMRGPRTAICKALEIGIVDSIYWEQMVEDKNLCLPEINKNVFQICSIILEYHYVHFSLFEKKMLSLSGLKPE